MNTDKGKEKMEIKEKRCTKCGEVKSVDMFHKNRKLNDGHAMYCKPCRAEVDKKYSKKYYQENKEKVDKKNKKYYQKNKEKVDKQRKKYYKENKEQIQKRKKKQSRECHKVYIKTMLCRQFKIKISEITPEMIEIKRAELFLKRELITAGKEEGNG